MPPPCKHPEPEKTRDTCSLCRVYCTHEGYRRQWNGLPPQPEAPVPYEQWPAWVKAMVKWKQEGEAGAGDTAHRLLESMGVDWFWKTFVVKLLGSCKCEQRRRALNQRYPYSTDPAGG